MAYKYSYQKDEQNSARAVLRDAPISSKQAIEVCSVLRNKSVEYAKNFLEEVIAKKRAVKFSRFTEGAGHKTGIGPGKYPIKTSQHLLKLLNSVESNAISAGLSTDLKIVHLSAQRASSPWHMGRQRRRQMKRTHVEIVVQEIEAKSKKKTNLDQKVVTAKEENKEKEMVKENNSNKPKSESQPKSELKEEKTQNK